MTRIEKVVLNRQSIRERVLQDLGGLGIEAELVARAKEVLPDGMEIEVRRGGSRLVVRIVDSRSWARMPWGQRARTRAVLQKALSQVRGGRFRVLVGEDD